MGLWKYVPEYLSEKYLPRCKVMHLSPAEALLRPPPRALQNLYSNAPDIAQALLEAFRYGGGVFLKTLYSVFLSLKQIDYFFKGFDHLLSFWGNYPATCAYLCHRILKLEVPYSIYLRAMDLYYDRVFLRQKLLYADNLIMPSRFNSAFLQENYPDIYPSLEEKFFFHYEGVEVCNALPNFEHRSSNLLIAIGRFEKCKGFDYLIRSMEQLRNRGLDLKLDIIGDGAEKGLCERLVRDLSLEDRVRFRGWLLPGEVKLEMRNAAIFIHPAAFLDSSPTVIKEAMALGTPVIATQIAGIPELLDYGRCGVLVPPKDVMQLTEAISKLLNDAELRKGYADNAYAFAKEKFDFMNNGKQLAERLRMTKRTGYVVGNHLEKSEGH